MKFGIVVVLALIAAAIVAQFLLQDPGYVVINFRNYVIEMSVPVLLAGIVLILFLAWLSVKVFRAPRRLGEAASRYRSGRAGARLTRGMIDIAEGNFAKGEKLLARTAASSDAPLLNYLQAARAAHLQGNTDRRDDWLRQAYEKTPEAASAVLLTQAELQLDQRQFEQALATLRSLQEKAPNHSHALNLLGRLYYRLEDWEQLGALLPRLRKHGRVDSVLLDRWSIRVHRESLDKAVDAAALAAAWATVPKNLRRDPELLDAWYRGLIRTGQHQKAEKDLAAELKRHWQPPLVRLFGMIESDQPAKQLSRAESWLKTNPDDVELLLTTARLCLKNELWGKARSYLETVIALRPTPEAYQEYGRLLARLGEDEAAADAYRAGLSLVTPPLLPALTDMRSRTGR
ncbi:MAG: heme biosynthesis HemY N-terminal domain-containing protein [Woeseia sp.]